ncbi:unnamed protein product [Arabidopsis lyrata]|nr:unnamed protein product [Arabidopsis lyrata]
MQLIHGVYQELYSLADLETTKYLPLTTFHSNSMFLFSKYATIRRSSLNW